MTKSRIVLMDDDERSLALLQYYIEPLPDFQIVDKCRNREELIDSVMRTRPDAVLMDIPRHKPDGLDAIRTCLSIRSDLLFVLIADTSEYAVEAFELSAVDYVVKPYEKKRLYAALEKISNIRRSGRHTRSRPDGLLKKRLIIREGNDYYFVPAKEILFIEKQGKKCLVYTSDKDYVTNDKLSELLGQLPESLFFLSHRSYIVNVAKINCILARNQTFLAYFAGTDKYAHVSKLKIDELQKRLK